MGNCLVVIRDKKAIKLMTTDGEISSIPLPLARRLDVGGKLGGRLEPICPMAEAGVVRIKLVVSKEELKEMIRNGGVSLVHGLLREERNDDEGSGKLRSLGWCPALESIPEGNDF